MVDRLLCETDMEFQIFDWLGLETRLSNSEFDGETARAFFGLSQKLAASHFLPHYKASDTQEPRLENGNVHVLPEIGTALAEYRDLGLFGASFPEELGGMGMPYLLTSASYAWFAAANCSSIGYTMLTGANARLIAAFGNIAQIDTPYLTETTSGLTYVVDRFKQWEHSGHITLQRGERSRLADHASEIL